MKYQLKSISKAGIPEALEKAGRYRLLNEPRLAESICHDILAIEPDNHRALITMLLSITDQFGRNASINASRARQLLPSLGSEYERAYYAGIICERQGTSLLNAGAAGSQFTAYELLTEAMDYFEKAEAMRPPENDDAILRWNTCARQIMSHHLQARQEMHVEPPLE